VFASGVGAELGGGGRYDHLIGRFGRDLPSTGFALDVDRLFHAVGLPQAGTDRARIDYMVAGPRRSMRLIIETAKKLRRGHRRVTQHLVKGSDQALVANALAAGEAQGTGALIILGVTGMDKDQVALFEGLSSQNAGSHNGRPKRPVMKKVALSALTGLAGRSRRQKASS